METGSIEEKTQYLPMSSFSSSSDELAGKGNQHKHEKVENGDKQ